MMQQDIPAQVLTEFCRRWKVTEFALFGSILREDFGPESDVDVLITFEEGAPWSLLDIMKMRDELMAIFGRPVDIVEKDAITNPFRRDEIMKTHRVLYAA